MAHRRPATTAIAMAYDPPGSTYDWAALAVAVALALYYHVSDGSLHTLRQAADCLWHAWMVFWLARMVRWRSFRYRADARCVTVSELAEAAGLDEAAVTQELAGRGVLPRYVNSGVRYYDRADVGDAAILLRPAEDTAAEVLLRPAEDSANLLRAAAEGDNTRS